VLEQELRDSPGLANHLQVVESIDHVLCHQLLQHSASAQHSLIRYNPSAQPVDKNAICNEAGANTALHFCAVKIMIGMMYDCTGRLSDHRF